jgi:predicted amidohydrolase YtcJ
VPTRYSNAKIWLGQDRGFSSALTVDGSRIVSNDIDCDEVIDCGGLVILPAFTDGHAHPVMAGREHAGPQITQARTVSEIQHAISRWLVENPGEDWVVGGAYQRDIVDEGRFLAAWLDEVSPDRPIVLHGDDHHTIWVNSEAMRRAGVDTVAPSVTDGSIDVDASGCPTGVFREAEAKALIFAKMPPATLDQELAALSWSHRSMLELGITAVQDAWVDQELAQVYLAAAKRDLLEVQTNLAFWWQPSNWRVRLLESIETRDAIEKVNNSKLSATTVKFFLDGVFGSATAMVSERYETTGELGNPVWERETLYEAMTSASEAGFQLHIHAIGDAASALALDAIVHCRNKLEELPHNPVMAHLELLNQSDIERIAKLDVTANFQPLWARPDGMLNSCRPHLGERLDNLYRTRSVLEEGAQVTFGSDWPVSDPNPLLGAYTAVARSLPGENLRHNPNESLNLEQALHAYTRASALQIGLVDRGTLSVGSSADFVIINGDPFENLELLPTIQVVKTISGGKTMFTRH